MSKKDGILDFVVKQEPFDDLLCGFKREEYREDDVRTSFWAKRLLTPKGICILRTGKPDEELDWLDNHCDSFAPTDHFYQYHTARFSLGYQPGRPSFLRKIKRIRWGAPRPEWTYGIVRSGSLFVTEIYPCA